MVNKKETEGEEDSLPPFKIKPELGRLIKKRFFTQAGKPEGFAGELFAQMVGAERGPLIKWAMKVSQTKINPDHMILEIGHGAGHNIQAMADIIKENGGKGKIYGIDIADKMVELASKKNEDHIKEERVELKKSNAENLSFSDNVFDFMISIESINFWKLDEALKEIFRTLKPDGMVLILNNSYKHERFAKRNEEWASVIDQEWTLYTPREFNERFKKAGFEDVVVYTLEEKNYISIKAKKKGKGF